jgi:hemerythrin superfamily protein
MNSATPPMNLFEALRASHDLQRQLCRSMLRVKPDERDPVFLKLKIELEAHAAAEERFLYVPLLMTNAGLSSSRHALAEHHRIEELCAELSVPDKSTDAWLDTARRLSRTVHHHLREEERKFFPQAGKLIADSDKTVLGRRYLKDLVEMRRHCARGFRSVAVDRSGMLVGVGAGAAA